jgi:exodeoxyribonuclease VII large subunit
MSNDKNRYPLFAEERERGPESVTQLTHRLKILLEGSFNAVHVEGELSNVSRPRSGHIYLTLKDEGAQVSGVLWRSTASRLKFEPRDGMKVVCRGTLNVYPPHGKYQLVVDRMEPQGVGALELAFRQLHERLKKEGLFDPALKQPLPRWVRRVAVVTSPTGAAIRDFLQVLKRRWRGIDVLIVPVRVQGDGAAREIAEAIDRVNRMADPVDCLVVTRGGGSLEDLWAFNEEPVVRAIRRSTIPVVSGVGHEVDTTLSDLVADVRALTPSEAAERISPSETDVLAQLSQLRARMSISMESRLRFGHSRLEAISRSSVFRRPETLVIERSRNIDWLEERLLASMDRLMESRRQSLARHAARLESLSPLGVLQRGYSLTEDAEGRLIRRIEQTGPGQTIRTRVSDGAVVSRVESVKNEK